MIDQNSVKEKISQFLKLPVSKLKDETALIDIITDSFVLIEMIIELQEYFGVSFVQEDLKNVKTVGELSHLFVSHGKESRASIP